MAEIVSKEFVIYLAKYISENDFDAKKYIDAYWREFLKLDNAKINLAYRFWDFSDTKILNMINGDNIKINKCNFLSYYTNVSNTKNMVDFLEMDAELKIFYAVEMKKNNFKSIYEIFQNINQDEYSNEELRFITKTLEEFKKENEHIRLNVEPYNLNMANTRFLIVHERLGQLLEYNDYKRFDNGYYIYEVSDRLISYLQTNPIIKYLLSEGELLNYNGLLLLDKYHKKGFYEED